MTLKEDKLAHTSERLYLRWGIRMTPEEIEDQINKRIQAGESEVLGRTTRSRTIHRLDIERVNPRTLEEEKVDVVFYYDKVRNTVITALGPEMEPVIVHPA